MWLISDIFWKMIEIWLNNFFVYFYLQQMDILWDGYKHIYQRFLSFHAQLVFKADATLLQLFIICLLLVFFIQFFSCFSTQNRHSKITRNGQQWKSFLKWCHKSIKLFVFSILIFSCGVEIVRFLLRYNFCLFVCC